MAELNAAIAVKPKQQKKSRLLSPALTYPFFTILAILVIWEIVGLTGLIDPFMFSWPSKIILEAWFFTVNGSVFKHLLISLFELGIGFGLALIGIPIGLAVGYWRKLEYSFDPIITALYTTPMVALTPLFIIWFGLETLSKVMMVFTMSIFPILINTMTGVKMTEPSLIKAAKSYGASEFQMFKEVIFPSTMSYIMAGIRLGLGRAMIAVVVAEMLAANKGIGYAIRHASELFRTAEYLAYVGVLMVVSVLLTEWLKVIERKISPWRN
jgi:ABC-type nitrate/sulfonate/bicarbonate transport system permease component